MIYDTYWMGPKSMYTFRFKEITHVDVDKYSVFLNSKANNDLHDFDVRLIKFTTFILKSLSRSINDSLLQGRFVRIEKDRVFHQSMKNREILISRVILDQCLSLDILLDLMRRLCALKLFSTRKVMISYPMNNLRIPSDTLLKLAYTEWSMFGLIT